MTAFWLAMISSFQATAPLMDDSPSIHPQIPPAKLEVLEVETEDAA